VNTDSRWEVALRIVEEEGRVTRGRLARAAQVSDRTASRALKAMVADGLLLPDGRAGRHAGFVKTAAVEVGVPVTG